MSKAETRFWIRAIAIALGLPLANVLSLPVAHPAAPQLVSGTAHGQVQPAQTPNSLLAGKTPLNFSGLAGWTTVLKEDFHTGALAGATGGASNEYTKGTPGIVSGKSHSYSGTGFALRNDVGGDGFEIVVGVGNVPPSAEQYFSWWVNYSGTVNIGDDFFLGRIVTNIPPPPGHSNQDCKVDPEDGGMPPDYVGISSVNVFVCEGPSPDKNCTVQQGCTGTHLAIFQGSITLRSGQWTQYELWFRANSCTGVTGNNDGFYRFYVNGVLSPLNGNNINLVGCQGGGNFSAGSTKMETDGVYTSYYFGQTAQVLGNPCLPGDGSISTAFPIRCNPFSQCPKLQTNGHTCLGSVQPFTRWTSDVIFLRR
jgi:hypothetical protein